jgi:cellulose 1,4-beta-cellobiosidase
MTKVHAGPARAAVAAALVGAAVAVAVGVPAGTAHAAAACEVGYELRNEYPENFQSRIFIHNHGAQAVDGWTLAFTYPGDQRLSLVYGAYFTQPAGSGAVALTPTAATKVIPAGGKVSLPLLQGRFTNDNGFPSGFTLNGQLCDVSPPQLLFGRTDLTVREGGWNRVSVALTGPPATAVTVAAQIVDGDPDLNFPYLSRYQQLTFTPDNWKVLQEVAVMARHDPDNVSGTANLTLTSDSPGTAPASIRVTEFDDDTADGPVIIMTPDPRNPRIVPEGGQIRFTIQLPAPPSNPVPLTVFHGSDKDIRVVAGQNVTFTRDNWNVPHEMTIAAAEDTDSIDGWTSLIICGPGGALPVLTTIWYEADNDR